MTATWALIVDAYRDLNSKKLFWLSVAISGLIVLVFAMVGINEKGITLLWWTLGDPTGMINSTVLPEEQFYKSMFLGVGVKFWLAWGATILAIISTAGLIPSFVQGGAVELVLSKPVSRVRLFLTKFACGLLFVGLQVLAFSLASFLVIGVRGKSWEPGVFLAVPLVVVFFSYLYSICALIGLVTRSTIAALLLTILAWFLLFAINSTDGVLLTYRELNAMTVERTQRQVAAVEKSTTQQWQQLWVTQQSRDLPADAPRPVAPTPTREQLEEGNPRLGELRESLADAEENLARWKKWSSLIVGVKTVVPKTSETIDLLSRTLEKNMQLPGADEDESAAVPDEGPVKVRMGQMSAADEREFSRRMIRAVQERSVWWVLGTSLLFEAGVLALACWIFKRRDF